MICINGDKRLNSNVIDVCLFYNTRDTSIQQCIEVKPTLHKSYGPWVNGKLSLIFIYHSPLFKNVINSTPSPLFVNTSATWHWNLLTFFNVIGSLIKWEILDMSGDHFITPYIHWSLRPEGVGGMFISLFVGHTTLFLTFLSLT